MSFRIRRTESRNSSRNGYGESQVPGLPGSRDTPAVSRNNRRFPKNNQCSADFPMIGGALQQGAPKARGAWPHEGAEPEEPYMTRPDGSFINDASRGLSGMKLDDLDTQAQPQRNISSHSNNPTTGGSERPRNEVNSTEWDAAFYTKDIGSAPKPILSRTRGAGRANMLKDNECIWYKNMQESQSQSSSQPHTKVSMFSETEQPSNEFTRASPSDGGMGGMGSMGNMGNMGGIGGMGGMPPTDDKDWYMQQMRNIQQQQAALQEQQQTLLQTMASHCPTPAPEPAAQPPRQGQTLAQKSQAAKEVYEDLLQQQSEHDQMMQQEHFQHQQQMRMQGQQEQMQQDYALQLQRELSHSTHGSRSSLQGDNMSVTSQPQGGGPKTPRRRLKGSAAKDYAARDEGSADNIIFQRNGDGEDDEPEMEISAREQDSRNDMLRCGSVQPSVSNARSRTSNTGGGGLGESMSQYEQDPSERRSCGARSGARTPHWQESCTFGVPASQSRFSHASSQQAGSHYKPVQSPATSVTPTPHDASTNNVANLLCHVKRRLETEHLDGKVSPAKSVASIRRAPSPARSTGYGSKGRPAESLEKEWWEDKSPPKEVVAPRD